MSDKLLPIVILAHNEGKTIQKLLESAISQEVPNGFNVEVIVAINACTDNTKEIVQLFANLHPNKVVLLSFLEKGKVRTLNKVIDYLNNRLEYIPYVIIVDSDCVFSNTKTLLCFVYYFETIPGLAVVSATTIPDVILNDDSSFMANIYRAVYILEQNAKMNTITGMCYGIKLEILKRIKFPDFQFAEDLFLASRVEGHLFKAKDIGIIFTPPKTIKEEIIRRIKHRISYLRYDQYYGKLKKRGIKVPLFNSSLGPECEWKRESVFPFIFQLFREFEFKILFYLLSSFLIRHYALIGAWWKDDRMKERNEDYWPVNR